MAYDAKTKPTRKSVKKFIAAIEHDKRRADAEELLAIYQDATGEKAVMWGDALVGFGRYHYKYASGHEGDFMRGGFSPRKTSLSLYIMPGFKPYAALLKKLGKHKLGVGCMYINKLDDIDRKVLRTLIKRSFNDMHDIDGGC